MPHIMSNPSPYSCPNCIKAPCPTKRCFNAVRQKIADVLNKLQKCAERAFKGRYWDFEWRWATITSRHITDLIRLRRIIILVQNTRWCLPRLTMLVTTDDLLVGDTEAAQTQAQALCDAQCVLLHTEQNILLKPLTDFWKQVCNKRGHSRIDEQATAIRLKRRAGGDDTSGSAVQAKPDTDTADEYTAAELFEHMSVL